MSLDDFMEAVDEFTLDAIIAIRERYRKWSDKNSICNYGNFSTRPYPTRIKQDQNDFYSMSYAHTQKMHEFTEVSHADYSHKSRESKIDDVKQKGKSN